MFASFRSLFVLFNAGRGQVDNLKSALRLESRNKDLSSNGTGVVTAV